MTTSTPMNKSYAWDILDIRGCSSVIARVNTADEAQRIVDAMVAAGHWQAEAVVVVRHNG